MSHVSRIEFDDFYHVVSVSFTPNFATLLVDDFGNNYKIFHKSDHGFTLKGSIATSGTENEAGLNMRERRVRFRSCVCAPDNRRGAVIDDKVVKIVDLTQPEAEPKLLSGHIGSIMSIDWGCPESSQKNMLVSAGIDKMVFVFDVDTQAPLHRFIGHAWTVFCVEFVGKDCSSVVSASGIWDKRCILWELSDEAEIDEKDLPPHVSEIVMGSAFSPTFDTFASCGQNGTHRLKLWGMDHADNSAQALAEFGYDDFHCPGYAPAFLSEKVMACPDGGGHGLGVFEKTEDHSWARSTSSPFTQIPCGGDVCLSPDFSLLMSVTHSGIQVWSTKGPTLLSSIGTGARHMDCCPLGKFLLTCEEGIAQVWSLTTFKKEFSLGKGFKKPQRGSNYVQWSPCGSLLAAASSSFEVVVWSASTRETLYCVSMWDRSYRLVFSFCSQILICGGDDKTVVFWDSKNGKDLGRIYIGAGVGTLSIGRGGRLVMAGDDMGRVVQLQMQHYEAILHHPIVSCRFVFDVDVQAFRKTPTALDPYTGEEFSIPPDVLAKLKPVPDDCSPASLAYLDSSSPFNADQYFLPVVGPSGKTLLLHPMMVDNRRAQDLLIVRAAAMRQNSQPQQTTESDDEEDILAKKMLGQLHLHIDREFPTELCCVQTGHNAQETTWLPLEEVFPDEMLKREDITEGMSILARKLKNTEDAAVEIGMRLEAVDIKNPNLTCVATVKAIPSPGEILVSFDGWTDVYDYTDTLISDNFHPIGWCESNNKRLEIPRGYDKPFVWSEYLSETGSKPVPNSLLGSALNRVFQSSTFFLSSVVHVPEEGDIQVKYLDEDEAFLCPLTDIRSIARTTDIVEDMAVVFCGGKILRNQRLVRGYLLAGIVVKTLSLSPTEAQQMANQVQHL
eukprot:m.151682 g.151682  ORF g.151682 m.151682 type:complete len:895 (+) comp24515_c0_seq4:3149-5833(+)